MQKKKWLPARQHKQPKTVTLSRSITISPDTCKSQIGGGLKTSPKPIGKITKQLLLAEVELQQ